jgi:quercetin dioxygenase-like cupin family protein
MRKLTLSLGALVVTVSLGVTAADASPPSGQLSWTDHGRAEVAESGPVATPAGSGTFIETWTLAPGAATGWRTAPGSVLLAVVSGHALVHRSEGCTVGKIPAGSAVVVPAGALSVSNDSAAPLHVAAAFFNLPDPRTDPLTSGPPVTPAGCSEVSTGAGITAERLAGGTFGTGDIYQGHTMQVADVTTVDAGGDVLFSTYVVEPGFSTGWINHRGQFGAVTAGTLAYYEEHDGKCVRSDAYSAGEAFVHAPHTHMAVNEGHEQVTLAIVHFNLPHNESPVPVVGNQSDAFDFTPMPPAGCPRLR